jgi:hypothetical protein
MRPGVPPTHGHSLLFENDAVCLPRRRCSGSRVLFRHRRWPGFKLSCLFTIDCLGRTGNKACKEHGTAQRSLGLASQGVFQIEKGPSPGLLRTQRVCARSGLAAHGRHSIRAAHCRQDGKNGLLTAWLAAPWAAKCRSSVNTRPAFRSGRTSRR